MEYVFKSENLTKKYGSFTALDNLNLTIPNGAIYGFVGKNGAGDDIARRLRRKNKALENNKRSVLEAFSYPR